jgi:hypothetical protein
MTNKNKHINHIEDEMFINGHEGLGFVIRTFEHLLDMLEGKPSLVHLSTKWDGSPAIVCGKNPENGKFFVGTKSVFNKKTPKLNYTFEDIQANHSDLQLQQKLKICLEELSKLGIENVLQGDMMFMSNTLEIKTRNNRWWFGFTPNTLTYEIPWRADSPLTTANLGIVFHTSYEGETIQEMEAHPDVDLSKLNIPQNVWCIDATPKLLPVPVGSLHNRLDTIRLLAERVDPERLKFHKKSLNYLLKSMNEKIREGNVRFSNTYCLTSLGEEINDVHHAMVAFKLSLLGEFHMNDDIEIFHLGERTTHEGYVVTNTVTNKRTKLVNRAKFSRMNMLATKPWKEINNETA